MPHPEDYDWLIENGCENRDRSLGVQFMPEGYHLMLDADRMFFFWFERATGRISACTWNKWWVWKWAREDAAEHTAAGPEQEVKRGHG